MRFYQSKDEDKNCVEYDFTNDNLLESTLKCIKCKDSHYLSNEKKCLLREKFIDFCKES